MITKNDCLILLSDIEKKGIDTSATINELLSNGMTLNVIKFINDNRQLDVSAFYEKIRKSYNQKKSNLYGNIVKENYEDANKVLTTLTALLNQILLYSKNVQDRQMFLKHSRAKDITKVLNGYFTTWDITNCIKLLRLIKVDLKALESVK